MYTYVCMCLLTDLLMYCIIYKCVYTFNSLAVALFVPPVLLSQSYYSSYSNDDTISAIDKDSFDDMTTDTAYNRVVVERLSFVHLTQAVAMCILLVIEIIR